VTRARGSELLNTVEYVRQRFGEPAHERVLATLPADARTAFDHPTREADWQPLEYLVAYMLAAREQLAAGEGGFYREIGRHAGRSARTGGFQVMLGTIDDAVRTARYLWRSFFDTGRLEIVTAGPEGIVARVLEFACPSPVVCDRITGWTETSLDPDGALGLHTVEVACVHEGAPYCEYRTTWGLPTTAPPGEPQEPE